MAILKLKNKTTGEWEEIQAIKGNGIATIEKTSTSGLVDTYTITFTNGSTTTFDVSNGEVTREELEEEVDRLSMIYNAFPTTTGEGEEPSINGTAEVPFKEIGLKGNTSQDSTTGKNLYNVFDGIQSKTKYTTVDSTGWLTMEYDNTNGSDSIYSYYSTNNLDLTVSTQYSLMVEIKEMSGTFGMEFATTYSTSQNATNIYTSSNKLSVGIKKYLITTKDSFSGTSEGLRTVMNISSGKRGKIVFRLSVLVDTSITTDNFNYEPYTGGNPAPNPDYPYPVNVVTGDNEVIVSNGDNTQSQTYPINLGSMELCKIGDYQDYLYKENGIWYKYGAIGKIASYNGETITTNYISTTGGLDTGSTIYYVQNTPTYEEITDSTLIEQLDNLKNAYSYDTQTNISQTNQDKPFIISYEAILSLRNVLNNLETRIAVLETE